MLLKFRKRFKSNNVVKSERGDIFTLMYEMQKDIKKFLIKVCFISVIIILCGIYVISYLMK